MSDAPGARYCARGIVLSGAGATAESRAPTPNREHSRTATTPNRTHSKPPPPKTRTPRATPRGPLSNGAFSLSIGAIASMIGILSA